MVCFTIDDGSGFMKYNITILIFQMKSEGTERSGDLPNIPNLGVLV